MKDTLLTDADLSLWEEIKKSVRPLGGLKKNLFLKSLPPRLRVHASTRGELIDTLDLHGMTVEEAYQTFCRFFEVHVAHGSRAFKVITGRGLHGESQIKKEMPHWLKHAGYAARIARVVWTADGGALTIELKRKKK